MNERSKNMKLVNKIRSSETNTMLNLLDALDNGTDIGYGGYEAWNIKYAYKLKIQLNSYRANKISMLLGKNINKQKLLRYAKPSDYKYKLSNEAFNFWLDLNAENLKKYWEYSSDTDRINIYIENKQN